MSKHETEIRALVVKMQDLITRYEFDELEELNETLESLCRRDLNEMMGCVMTVPGTVYAAWSAHMDNHKKIPNKLVGESEVYGSDSLYAVRPGSTEERFNEIMARHYGLLKPQLGSDVDPITIEDEFPRVAISSAVKHLDRNTMIGQLEMWKTQATSLKLVAQGLIFSKEIDRLQSISDVEYDALKEKVNPNVIGAIIYLGEVYTQNVMAERLNTNSFMFRGVMKMNREEYIEFLRNWRDEALKVDMLPETQILDGHINNLWGMTDEQYKGWKQTKDSAIASSIQRIAKKLARVIMGDEKFGTRAVIRNEQPTGRSKETRNIGEVEIPYTGRLKGIVQRGVSLNELPTDESGAVADINVHDKPLVGSYLQPTKPEGYRTKLTTNQPAMERLTAEKEMLQVFCTILSKEMADRLARDLEHLINITDDAEYAEAISQEVRRIRLFAEGHIKTLSDVNFAWVYHDK